MSFPTDITLNDLTPAAFTYSQISLEGGKSIRTDAARGLGEPRSLVISHQTSGSGLSAVDRHLVRLQDTQEDTGADSIAVLSGSAYIVIEKPRRIITDADITSMVEQLVDFLTPANLTKILNGEP